MNMMRVIDGIEFVEKNYVMDRRTDGRLSSGRQLRDGMLVLIDSPWHRANLDMLDDDVSEYNVALWNNRWAEISDVKIEKDRVFFTARYIDGSLTRKHHMIKLPWLVKKEKVMDEKLLPHHTIMQNWYTIAQEAIGKAFEGFEAMGIRVDDEKVHMSAERIAQLAAKTALDAVLPYVLEEMKGKSPSVYTTDPDKVDLVAQPYFDVPGDDGKTPSKED